MLALLLLVLPLPPIAATANAQPDDEEMVELSILI